MQYQKEDVRKRIVEAAKTEFLRVGFARTSMLAVSNRAKVPIGNLYRYFSSKAALFDAIVGTAKERLIECAKEICALNIEGLESGKESIIDMANVVGDCLADYAQDYSKELILLLEKSGGSAYADFTNEIIVFASDLCKQRFYTDPLKRNDYLCELVANHLTRGIFRIMIECPQEEQRAQLAALFIFYFNHLEDRL